MSALSIAERHPDTVLYDSYNEEPVLLAEPFAETAAFEEIVTPEPADALFAARAVQLAIMFNKIKPEDQDCAHSAEVKLVARARAAISHSVETVTKEALNAPIVPKVSSIAIVTPRQVIGVEVSEDDIRQIEPDAADIADSTGVHIAANSDHDLSEREIAYAKKAAIAKAIIDEKQAAATAKDALLEDIHESERVPVLSADELEVLHMALEKQVLYARDKADRLQAVEVLREYGMPVPVARKAMGGITMKSLINLAHGRRTNSSTHHARGQA